MLPIRAVLVSLLGVFACAPAVHAPSTVPPTAGAPTIATPKPRPPLPVGVDESYTVELVRQPFPYVSVTFVSHGDLTGATRVGLDHWGGVDDPQNEVHGLTATDEQGHPLVIEADEALPDADTSTWTVHHERGSVLVVRYAIVPTRGEVRWDGLAYHRPLVTPTFFHAAALNALLGLPDAPHDQPLRIAFHWRGFKEAGWTVASSFSVSQDDFETTRTYDEFRGAILIAGVLRLLRRDIGPCSPPRACAPGQSGTTSPLWVAIAGSDWGFTDDAFADAAAAVAGTERAFFADYDWPFFLVSVIPVGGKFDPRVVRGFSGVGMTQSFALFVAPKTSLTQETSGRGIMFLMSHELFHSWNGRRYKLQDPQELGLWFSEGFTDFYARRLSYRAGLMSAASYVEDLNKRIERYTLSPFRDEPAERIVRDFWRDPAIGDLPYLRGNMVASLVDAQIRLTSGGSRSLDDLMKELLSARPAEPPRVTSDTFLAKIAAFTSPAFAERIRQIVVFGAAVKIEPKSFEPCLRGSLTGMSPFDAGFDQNAAKARKVVSGVSVGSNAYRAGLRDGQRIASWSLHDGDRSVPAEVTIEDGATKRTIRYLPEGKPLDVAMFALVEPMPEGCGRIL
jgi:predicted metalloprotease with PDZ domain